MKLESDVAGATSVNIVIRVKIILRYTITFLIWLKVGESMNFIIALISGSDATTANIAFECLRIFDILLYSFIRGNKFRWRQKSRMSLKNDNILLNKRVLSKINIGGSMSNSFFTEYFIFAAYYV